jgi:two-component system, LytTR family, response regulator
MALPASLDWFIVLVNAQSTDVEVLSVARRIAVESMPVLVVFTATEKLAGSAFESRALELVTGAAAPRAFRTRFLVSIGNMDTVIHADEITWIRANGYYATLVLLDRREFLVRLPLDQLETELDPAAFIRVHRSAIVNLREIRALERTAARSAVVILRSGARIPASRSRREALVRALGGS